MESYSERWRRTWCEWVGPALFVTVVVSVLLWLVHDQYLYVKDEGYFGYLAQQVAAGRVFGVEIYDIHGGYQTWLNALMFRVFGEDLLHLRYPVMLMTLLQAVLVVYLCRSVGWMIAASVGMASVMVGFLFLPLPSPNLYAVFGAFVVGHLLASTSFSWWRVFLIGGVIGLVFMFRHPSAVFIGIGVMMHFLYQSRAIESSRSRLPGWIAIAASSLLLGYYLWFTFEPFAFVLFGTAPVVVLALLFGRVRSGLEWRGIVIPAVIGFCAALLPMVMYQWSRGDVWVWFRTAFLDARSLTDLEFFSEQTYIHLVARYTAHFVEGAGIEILPYLAIYWLALFSLPLILGFQLVQRIRLRQDIPALAWVALFFAVGAIYYQNLGYYLYVVPPLLVAVAWFLQTAAPHYRHLFAACALFIGTVSCVFGFGLSSYQQDTVPSGFANASLQTTPDEQRHLQAMVHLVQASAAEGESVFAFPLASEIYYFSKRQSPFPEHGTFAKSLGAGGAEELFRTMDDYSVRVFVHNHEHPYNGLIERELIQWLTQQPLETEQTFGDYTVYVRRLPGSYP
jgi:hypothetical protein